MASNSPSASGHHSGGANSPFWKGILSPLSVEPQVGVGHPSNGAVERSPARSVGNKGIEAKGMESGCDGDEKRLLGSRGSVFGSELQWGGSSPGPSLSPCDSGLWGKGAESKGLETEGNGGGDSHEVHGVLLQMKHLEEVNILNLYLEIHRVVAIFGTLGDRIVVLGLQSRNTFFTHVRLWRFSIQNPLKSMLGIKFIVVAELCICRKACNRCSSERFLLYQVTDF